MKEGPTLDDVPIGYPKDIYAIHTECASGRGQSEKRAAMGAAQYPADHDPVAFRVISCSSNSPGPSMLPRICRGDNRTEASTGGRLCRR